MLQLPQEIAPSPLFLKLLVWWGQMPTCMAVLALISSCYPHRRPLSYACDRMACHLPGRLCVDSQEVSSKAGALSVRNPTRPGEWPCPTSGAPWLCAWADQQLEGHLKLCPAPSPERFVCGWVAWQISSDQEEIPVRRGLPAGLKFRRWGPLGAAGSRVLC